MTRSASNADPVLRSLLWRLVGRHLYRLTFHNWYESRRILLRLFGADIHPKADLRPTIDLDRPWNFAAGELTLIGDFAVFRARAPLRIGARCVISQYAVLSTESLRSDEAGRAGAGERDIVQGAITVHDDCWIAAEALIMPGVTIGAGAVVGARSLIDQSLPPWSIAAGEPATIRGQRRFTNAATSSS